MDASPHREGRPTAGEAEGGGDCRRQTTGRTEGHLRPFQVHPAGPVAAACRRHADAGRERGPAADVAHEGGASHAAAKPPNPGPVAVATWRLKRLKERWLP